MMERKRGARGEPERKAIDWNERRDSIDEIARRLNELLRSMADTSHPARPEEAPADGSVEAARRVRRVRQERKRIFGSTLTADPAWDLLLELFIAMGEGREVTVGSAAAATGVPEATVLRCIAHLAEAQLVVRQPRPFEDATMYLTLTERAVAMISEYLDRVMSVSGAGGA